MGIITVALSTRLKRRVFSNEKIKNRAKQLFQNGASSINADIIETTFLEYGVILCLENKEEISSDEIAYILRKSTSGPLRSEYQELCNMPSLWNRNFYSESGLLTETIRQEIDEYFDSVKKR